LADQVADYEVTSTVVDDGVLPCLRARPPARLGADGLPVAIWVLGPLARTPWAVARSRLEPVASVRSQYLPGWLEAGVGEWAHRPVVWVSAATAVMATLAGPPAMPLAQRLHALADAARGAHALHEAGQLHGAICPQAVAVVAGPGTTGTASFGLSGSGPVAVLAPPSLANGNKPLVQIGYPPLGFVDPQLLRGEGGRWSDIWALGATVRYCVASVPPYPGIEELPVVRALAQLLAAPRPAPVDLPGPVAALVDRCLAIDPESRPATADEVALALDDAAARL